jgi:hypothetical protein
VTVVESLHSSGQVPVEVVFRGIVLPLDPSQLEREVDMDVGSVGGWGLDLVVGRSVEGKGLVHNFDHLSCF